MLRIELSALSAQELKRLLDGARTRGQTALVEQLEAELAARPMRIEDWEPQRIGYIAASVLDAAEEPIVRRRSGVMAATAAIAAFVSAAVTWEIATSSRGVLVTRVATLWLPRIRADTVLVSSRYLKARARRSGIGAPGSPSASLPRAPRARAAASRSPSGSPATSLCDPGARARRLGR